MPQLQGLWADGPITTRAGHNLSPVTPPLPLGTTATPRLHSPEAAKFPSLARISWCYIDAQGVFSELVSRGEGGAFRAPMPGRSKVEIVPVLKSWLADLSSSSQALC